MVASSALLLTLPTATEARADVAQVTVVTPGGSEQTLALDALAGSEDVIERSYALRSPGGEAAQTISGFSLAKLLDTAGADPYSFSYLEVQRPAGGAVLLSRDQALDAGAFAVGPPAIYATGGGTGFLRPSAGSEDLNADDSFVAPQGISLVLRKGSPLRVRAIASTPWTRPGRPVRFSAVVDRAGSGERLTYSWYFDDGHSAAGAEASHSFARRGSYDVVVGVTSDGDDVGASAVVTVQVGAPPDGPDRKGGGRNEQAGAPDHGAADGPATGVGGGNGPSEETGVGGGEAGTVAPAPHVPSPAAKAQPDSAPPEPPTPQPDPQPSASESTGDLVEGELVSADASAIPAPTTLRAAARSGQLDGDEGDGGIPGVAWGLLGTLALLGVGALTETRSLLK